MKKFLLAMLAFSMVFCMVSCNNSSDAVANDGVEVCIPDFGGANRGVVEIDGVQDLGSFTMYNKNVLTPAFVSFHKQGNVKNGDKFQLRVFDKTVNAVVETRLLEAGSSRGAQVWGYWKASNKKGPTLPNYLNILEGFSDDGSLYLRFIFDDKNTQCSYMQMFKFDVDPSEDGVKYAFAAVYCDDISISDDGKTLHGDVRALQLTDCTSDYMGTELEAQLNNLDCPPEEELVIRADWFCNQSFNGVFIYSLKGYANKATFVENGGQLQSTGELLPVPYWEGDVTFNDVEACRLYIIETIDDAGSTVIDEPWLFGFSGSNSTPKYTNQGMANYNSLKTAYDAWLDAGDENVPEPTVPVIGMYNYITNKSMANSATQELYGGWTLL